MLDNNNNENNEMDSISSDFSYESERKQLENTSSLIRLWAFLIVIIGLITIYGYNMYIQTSTNFTEFRSSNENKNIYESNNVHNEDLMSDSTLNDISSSQLINEAENESVKGESESMRIYTFEEFDNETEPDFSSIIRLNGINYDPYLMYELDIPRKTFISLHEKFGLNAVYGESDWYEYHNKYCTTPSISGDSAGYFWIESNYEQYNYEYFNNNYIEKVKYFEPITFKATVAHELTSNLENYDYNKDYSMEEYTKFQYDYARDMIHNRFDETSGTDGYYRVNGMSILNGHDDLWDDYGRAKKIKVTMADSEYIFELEDKKEIQVFDIGYTQNTIEKPIEIKVEVLESYPGIKSNDVYIYDIRFGFDTSIMCGR